MNMLDVATSRDIQPTPKSMFVLRAQRNSIRRSSSCGMHDIMCPNQRGDINVSNANEDLPFVKTLSVCIHILGPFGLDPEYLLILLAGHYRSKHLIGKYFPCGYDRCERTFARRDHLQRHESKVHAEPHCIMAGGMEENNFV